jgi:L-amino acid N-acyltransferase
MDMRFFQSRLRLFVYIQIKMNNPSIRVAKSGDLEQILEIYNDIIKNTTAVYEYETQTLESRVRWFENKNRDGYPVFVAEIEERIVGFSSFGPFRAWAAYQYSVENSIYVDSLFRGKGIGRQLIEPLISSAKAKGFHAMLAGIDSTNLPSLKLHEAFGFEEVAYFKEVGFKFGKWLDLKFLELILGP